MDSSFIRLVDEKNNLLPHNKTTKVGVYVQILSEYLLINRLGRENKTGDPRRNRRLE